MAARWRIRHKLLLGLGLAAMLMVLLLGGTLRGLWSYYLTTNRIRARTAELAAAEKINHCLAVLVSDENISTLADCVDFDQDKNVKAVRKALNEYAAAKESEASGDHSFDTQPADFDNGLVERMRGHVAALGKAMAARPKNSVRGGGDLDHRVAMRQQFKPPTAYDPTTR